MIDKSQLSKLVQDRKQKGNMPLYILEIKGREYFTATRGPIINRIKSQLETFPNRGDKFAIYTIPSQEGLEPEKLTEFVIGDPKLIEVLVSPYMKSKF